MRVIALLPMKGHSERVPNKNMKRFSGKPLYHAIMQKLLGVNRIKKVLINTDSQIIADDAISNFGDRVNIVERPGEIRGDFVSMNKVIEHDLKVGGECVYLQTHSTNPLVRCETLDSALDQYFEKLAIGFDSLFSVTRFQTRFYDANGTPVNHNPSDLLRTQDLPPLYEENSNFYIFSNQSFEEAGKRRIGLNPSMFEVPALEAVDIDNASDFELAEMLYQKGAMV